MAYAPVENIVNGSITQEALTAFREDFLKDPRNLLARNAVSKTPVGQVALNRDIVTSLDHTYSITIKVGEATSQEKSGRCWLFAGLNTLRVVAMQQMNLEKFELSQNFPLFWDKLEKSNYFLESILLTLNEPIGSRLLNHILANPIQDGGQWDMFVNIIKKYGVVPKSVMPETESSSSTWPMTANITAKLREYAARLRDSHAKGASPDRLRAEKADMLNEVYRMLVIHLGEPPREFEWQWRDKDDNFHRDGIITPHEFFRRHVPFDLDSMVCLIHCPTADKRFDTMYTIEYLGNVVGGQIIRYLNVDLPVFKEAALAQLKDGRSVWFGCDVGKGLERELGVLDTHVLDYPLVYGTDFRLDKAQRLDYCHSAMNHAMVLTGVDLDDSGRPRKWRVENSWGDKVGDKGFLVMTDRWFDEYMYEVVVDKKYLPESLLPVLDTEPVALPPWDPMGALAR
ncbi:MAG: aminopeptidase [Fimbriimonadales bacterium]